MADKDAGMVTVVRHYANIGDRTRYAESEGRDKETGKLIWDRPDGKTRTELLEGRNFDYPVTDDRKNLRRAVRDMNRTLDRPREIGEPHNKGQTKKPAHELILSWQDGDHPTNEHMVETSRSALDRLGMKDALSLIFRHRDTDNDHVHIVSSRVNPRTGYVYRDAHERLKLRDWAREYQRERDRSRGRDFERDLEQARRHTIDKGAQRAWDRMPAPELTPTHPWTPWPARTNNQLPDITEMKRVQRQRFDDIAVRNHSMNLQPEDVKAAKQRLADQKLQRDGVEREREEARDDQQRDRHDGGGLHLIRNPVHGWINRAFSEYEGGVDELAIRGRTAAFQRQITEHKSLEEVQHEADRTVQHEQQPAEYSNKEPSDDYAITHAAQVDAVDWKKAKKQDRSSQMVHEVVTHEADHEMEMEMDDGFGGD